jgi:hypothetical protein
VTEALKLIPVEDQPKAMQLVKEIERVQTGAVEAIAKLEALRLWYKRESIL